VALFAALNSATYPFLPENRIMPKAREQRKGRRKGSRNKGYFFRKGRGWVMKVGSRFVALEDEQRNRLRDQRTPKEVIEAAYERAKAKAKAEADAKAKGIRLPDSVTVLDVCMLYLVKAQNEDSKKTFNDRADTLYDFCTGLPARFRDKKNGKPVPEPSKDDYIHRGYGKMPISELKPLHIDQWLHAHKTWKGGKRTRVQAVKRALNYAVESGLIPANPIKGKRLARQNARVTYLTPEQETALLSEANAAMASAIKVCIRTGARPGCEFGKLTARHVKDHGDRMEWTFQPQESKTKRLRVIRITDPEIIAIVRQQIAKHPSGELFRNTLGEPWTRNSISRAFRETRKRVEQKGMEFDKDTCMYSCRHTYAKRTLQGFWTGRQTNIETLARLMGNSPQVCRDHYLQWTDSYNEPLWESA
jgi:hypothetical protein